MAPLKGDEAVLPGESASAGTSRKNWWARFVRKLLASRRAKRLVWMPSVIILTVRTRSSRLTGRMPLAEARNRNVRANGEFAFFKRLEEAEKY